MNLNKYGKGLAKLNSNYESQRNRLDALNKSLFTFKDESKIELTIEQKQKMVEEAIEDVAELEKIVKILKISLAK